MLRGFKRFAVVGGVIAVCMTQARPQEVRAPNLMTSGEQLLQALTAPLEQRPINFGLAQDHPRPDPIVDNYPNSQSGQVAPTSKDNKLETSNTGLNKVPGSTSIVPAGKFLPRQ
jgi:hypothetical protein